MWGRAAGRLQCLVKWVSVRARVSLTLTLKMWGWAGQGNLFTVPRGKSNRLTLDIDNGCVHSQKFDPSE